MDDSISRQAAIDAMSCLLDSICEGQAVDALSELPTIYPVKRGKWMCFIETGSGLYDSIDIPRAKCSECGFKVPEEWAEFFKYCPNCGARMEADE